MPYADPAVDKAYHAAYREKHKDRMKVLHKEWRDKNREHVLAKGAAWRAANPEKHKATCKAWYDANAKTMTAWRHANTEKISVYQRECRMRNYARYVWRNVKKRALERGIPFELPYETAKAMLDATPVCPVFGVALVPSTGHAKADSPSFDCFIPALGYVPGNVRVISFRANALKGNATLQEIQALAAWMEQISTTVEGT